LIGGIGVALDNIFRLGSVDPALNPMYKKTFASHFALALWVTFISGPIALYRQDDFLYISGQSVLWLTALSFVLVYNRPEMNFGKIPTPWLSFRNAAELFFTMYVLFFRHEWFAHLHYQVLWWRLLDVLPRRLIRRWQIPDLIFLITGYITWVILCWYL